MTNKEKKEFKKMVRHEFKDMVFEIIVFTVVFASFLIIRKLF